MNLKEASIDDISGELARRDQPFFLVLASPNNPESQFHCSGIPPKICKALLDEGAKLMGQILEGGKIPDNVKIMRRITHDGKVMQEVEVTELSEDMFDPWEPKNKIGDYNPWKETDAEKDSTEKDSTEKDSTEKDSTEKKDTGVEESESKAETKSEEPDPEPSDTFFDPWKDVSENN